MEYNIRIEMKPKYIVFSIRINITPKSIVYSIGDLLNLLEWCPFIRPRVSGKGLSLARDECRNHWFNADKILKWPFFTR